MKARSAIYSDRSAARARQKVTLTLALATAIMLAASCPGVAGGLCLAKVMLNGWESDNVNVALMSSNYFGGAADALQAANALLTAERSKQLFCIPPGTVLGADDVVKALKVYVAERHADACMPNLGRPILSALQNRYPCP
jgi:hypothetical protein